MDDFEEIAKELNRDSNRIGKVIFIIVIIAAMGFLIFLGVKQILKEDNKKEKKKELENSIQSTDFNCHDTCDYTFHIDDQEIIVNYKMKLTGQENYTYTIAINGKEIFNQEMKCGGPIKMIVLEDTFVLQVRNHCDDPLDTLTAYDKDGNELFEYETLDTEYTNLKLRNTLLTVSNNKLVIRATGMKSKTILDMDGKQINICDSNELANNNINDNTVVEGTYNIHYQGDLIYEKPIRKKTITLEKYKKLYDIDKICNQK